MRNLFDIAVWSAAALFTIGAFVKADKPDPPVEQPKQDIVIQPTEAQRLGVSEETYQGWHKRLDAIQAKMDENKAILAQYVAKQSKDHDCPCGPGCKCVGECKCAWPGQCLGRPNPNEPETAEPQWYTNIHDARRAGRETGLPVLVHFYTKTCRPCAVMDRDVFPRVESYLSANVVCCKIDAATISQSDLAAWKVSTVPTDFVVQAGWPSGGMMKRLKFTTDPGTYLKALQEAVAWANQKPQERSVIKQSYQPAYYEPPRYYYQQPMYWGGYYGGGGCASGNCGW